MEIKDAYKQKLVAQLKEWSAQINLLEAKVENAGADIEIEHAEALQGLHAKQRKAAENMKELEKSSSETWEHVKEAADRIWDDLKAADARSKFK